LTETLNSHAYNICNATHKDLNNLEKIKNRVCNKDTFKYGISILHAHLRCYEYLLHIAYKLKLQQWQARGEYVKKKVKERKNNIVTNFYKEMGLVVDQPKQGGGNSNDDITARNFFKNLLLLSQITGIVKILIEKISNILCVIFCGHYIKEKMFKNYCFETAHGYFTLWLL
jgi:hypothetical protein